jgi:hypothetical protein
LRARILPETALSEEWRRDFERQSELEALAVPSEDGRGLNNEEAARFGRSWPARSEHRDHADRSIVITEIGIMIADIGGVITGIGPRDHPAG